MGIEATNRITDPAKIRARQLAIDEAEKRSQKRRWRKGAARYFQKVASGDWVADGCSKCGGGMSKRIHDFQKENRPGGTICSTCSRKEDKRAAKEL